MLIWTTIFWNVLSSASTALTDGMLCQQLPLFLPLASLFLFFHINNKAYSPYRLFLKSALDLIHIVICASPCCSISLHCCISFLSALERRVPLHLKCPVVTDGGCSYVYHLLPRTLSPQEEQQLHNLTRISQDFLFFLPTQPFSWGGWRIYRLKPFKVNNWS